MKNSLAFLASVLVLACGDGGDGGGSLNPDVESVPDGDGMGDALGGSYELEIYTSSCSGACTIEIELLGTLSYCDVGDSNSEVAQVTQTDGHLRLDLNDTPSRYDGGVDGDGSFDVLGKATEDGGAVEISVRAVGTIDAAGAVEARAQSHVRGVVEDQTVDCRSMLDVTGQRQG
jgi:hypothetical protein